MTGQQTVMLFDGIRLNTSTFRQGPNQYFFTIDSRSIQRLEVVRGSASTRWGSDAMAGALLATPIAPSFQPNVGKWTVRPRAAIRTATADGELGGRAQLDVGWSDRVALVGGVGYRDLGQLQAGGQVVSPVTGQPPPTPLFEADGRTQRGTGFRELTDDVRLVVRASSKAQVTLGWYDYRQFDAPRTDKCPAYTAPLQSCLRYEEQFRTLTYVALDTHDGPRFAARTRTTLSFQRQHELRQQINLRPTRNLGRDDVYTFGTGVHVQTTSFELGRHVRLTWHYGLDAYVDYVDSRRWNVYPTTGVVSYESRGQYLDGGRYVTSGAWTDVRATFVDRVEVRAGGRGGWVLARAAGDPTSGTAAVDRQFGVAVGGAGVSVRTWPWLVLVANVDQGFRAPNLDDLTSRQVTGPGFVYENNALRPERALTVEGGVRVDHPWIQLEVHGFETRIVGLVAKAPRATADCPPDDDVCNASKTIFQLVNLGAPAHIRGVDGSVRVFLPAGFGLRSTLSYAWGEGPNPIARPSDPDAAWDPRVPLSRIPPLNGTAEATWRGVDSGLFVGAAVRWAAAQRRLALADQQDPRIPTGGTPGFAVLDLRAGYRFDRHALLGVVFENVTDAAYRYHGSSVNGPGRGLLATLEVGF
jgi:iron complex outermembrane receptor protein/hemoglobin/transferrin/lactoferrin receptor protein